MKNHYQNAYVTHDLEWAVDHLSATFGLENWSRFDVECPVKTLDGEQLQASKVASAWGGHLQIELIEPVSGFIDPFLAFLPEDKSIRSLTFHHFAQRRETMEEIEREIDALGFPVACQGGIPDLIYTYLDTRPTLGHFTELVWATQAGWEMIGWPKGLAAG